MVRHENASAIRRSVQERARKREDLLRATEALLDPIAAAARREKRRLKGEDKIGVRVGKVVGKYKMAKHFELDIEEDSFGYRRKPESIAAEAALDGLYVVRTSLPAGELDAEGAVRAYKRLSAVERAFRSLKTVDLKVRPVFHRTADAGPSASTFNRICARRTAWLPPLSFRIFSRHRWRSSGVSRTTYRFSMGTFRGP